MDLLFDKEKPNKGRQSELDYAKTLLVFIMIITHLYEEASVVNFSEMPVGILENVIQLASGPAGAPLFMFFMGIGIVYTKNKESHHFIKRGALMFLGGYVLNLFRDVIPILIFGLPNGYATHPEYWEDVVYQTFNIDILMFAGLVLILTGLLRKLPIWSLAIIGIGMQIIGVTLSNIIDVSESNWQYVLGLFFYTSDVSCFPLLQWYIYPALGIIFGKYLRFVNDLDRLYSFLFYGSITVIAGFVSCLSAQGIDCRIFYALPDDGFFKQDFMHLLFCLPCMFLLLSAMHFACKFTQGTRLDNICKYIGPRLNRFYIVHWLFVGWISQFLSYSLNYAIPVWSTIPLAIVIYILSYQISKVLDNKKHSTRSSRA